MELRRSAQAKKDDDPKGEKLLQPEKIEEDSLKIVRNLCKYCALDDMTSAAKFFAGRFAFTDQPFHMTSNISRQGKI